MCVFNVKLSSFFGNLMNTILAIWLTSPYIGNSDVNDYVKIKRYTSAKEHQNLL
jgi:hypothetical protein